LEFLKSEKAVKLIKMQLAYKIGKRHKHLSNQKKKILAPRSAVKAVSGMSES